MNADLATGFLERASNKLNDSRTLCDRIRYAEAVSAAQESIELELSAKAAFLLLGPSHPRKHDFTEEEFLTVLAELPQELKFHNFPRLYLLHRFWSTFYTTAKYGLEVLGSPAKDLFQRPEAELAAAHASSWYIAATSLRSTLQTRATRPT